MNRGGAGKMKGRRNRRSRSASTTHIAWGKSYVGAIIAAYTYADLVSRDASRLPIAVKDSSLSPRDPEA